MNIKRLASRVALVVVIGAGYVFYVNRQLTPPMREVMRVYDEEKNLRVRRLLRYGNHGQLSLHYEPSGGLVNGPCTDFLTDAGIMLRGECRDGKWEGRVRGFGPGNELMLEGTYRDGMKDGVFHSYRNGRLNKVQHFSAGRLSGRQEDYYANGRVHCSGTYLEHRREGEYRCFYPDGTLRLEEHFRGGARHGLHRQWNDAGELTWEVPFTDGREAWAHETHRVRSVVSGDTIVLENDQRVRLKGIDEIPGTNPDGRSRPREILKELLRDGSRYAEVRLQWTQAPAGGNDRQAYVFVDTGHTLDDLKKKERYPVPPGEYYDFFPVRFSHFINASLIMKGAARAAGPDTPDRYGVILKSVKLVSP